MKILQTTRGSPVKTGCHDFMARRELEAEKLHFISCILQYYRTAASLHSLLQTPPCGLEDFHFVEGLSYLLSLQLAEFSLLLHFLWLQHFWFAFFDNCKFVCYFLEQSPLQDMGRFFSLAWISKHYTMLINMLININLKLTYVDF